MVEQSLWADDELTPRGIFQHQSSRSQTQSHLSLLPVRGCKKSSFHLCSRAKDVLDGADSGVPHKRV